MKPLNFLNELMVTMTFKILTYLCLILCLLPIAKAHTAVLFGASGHVGSEVYKALLDDPFWQELIVIGRTFPEKLEMLPTKKKITKLSLPSLAGIDQKEELQDLKADACFIAIGVPNPQDSSLEYWHSVEIDIVAAISRFCDQLHVSSVSLLSAVDAEEQPTSISQEEFQENTQLGWISMIKIYMRMKGLEELAAMKNAPNTNYIRLFQPNTILTPEYRYGWVDRCLFLMHKVLDPLLPTKYHSVHVKLLGMAMVQDAVSLLQTSDADDIERIARLTYGDYVRIAGEEFRKHWQAKNEL